MRKKKSKMGFVVDDGKGRNGKNGSKGKGSKGSKGSKRNKGPELTPVRLSLASFYRVKLIICILMFSNSYI